MLWVPFVAKYSRIPFIFKSSSRNFKKFQIIKEKCLVVSEIYVYLLCTRKTEKMKEQYEYEDEFFEDMVISDEIVDFSNYHVNTRAYFTYCKKHPNRTPDYVSYRKYNDGCGNLVYTNEISSEYWYEGEYVIRKSDHWSYHYGIASCWWELHKHNNINYGWENKDSGIGFCKLSDFKKYKYIQQ